MSSKNDSKLNQSCKKAFAIGRNSYAIGDNSIAWGNNSMAIGKNIVAQKEGSFVFGNNNEPNPNHIFSIGAGTKSHPRNLASMDKYGTWNMKMIKFRHFNVGDYFSFDGDKPQIGETVYMLPSGNVVKSNPDKVAIPIGVVVQSCSIISTHNPPDHRYKVDEWGDYIYQTVETRDWREAKEIKVETRQNLNPKFNGKFWIKPSNSDTIKTLSTKKRVQSVYDKNDTNIKLQNTELDIMESVKNISIQHVLEKDKNKANIIKNEYVMIDAPKVLVCMFGRAVILKGQATAPNWIPMGKSNILSDNKRIWYIK